MEKKIDTFYTKDIICPYCGYEDTESYEMEGEEGGWNDATGEYKCPECNMKFHWRRSVSVKYVTTKLCTENGKKHTWSEWKVLERENGEQVDYRECNVCEELQWGNKK
jgi:transposase-like protein